MTWISVPRNDGSVVVTPLSHADIETIRTRWYQTGECDCMLVPHLISTIDALKEALSGIIHIDEHGEYQPDWKTLSPNHPGQQASQEIALNTLKSQGVPLDDLK